MNGSWCSISESLARPEKAVAAGQAAELRDEVSGLGDDDDSVDLKRIVEVTARVHDGDQIRRAVALAGVGRDDDFTYDWRLNDAGR